MTPPGTSLLRRWAPFAAWALVLAGVSLYPRIPPLYPPGFGIDKVVHLWAWVPLGYTAACALPGRRPMAWLLAFGYGVLMELAQALVPGRSPEWYDGAADAAGAALGVFFAHLREVRHVRRKAAAPRSEGT